MMLIRKCEFLMFLTKFFVGIINYLKKKLCDTRSEFKTSFYVSRIIKMNYLGVGRIQFSVQRNFLFLKTFKNK